MQNLGYGFSYCMHVRNFQSFQDALLGIHLLGMGAWPWLTPRNMLLPSV